MNITKKLAYTSLFIYLVFLILLISKKLEYLSPLLAVIAFIFSRSLFYKNSSQSSKLENEKRQKISFISILLRAFGVSQALQKMLLSFFLLWNRKVRRNVNELVAQHNEKMLFFNGSDSWSSLQDLNDEGHTW